MVKYISFSINVYGLHIYLSLFVSIMIQYGACRDFGMSWNHMKPLEDDRDIFDFQ